MTTGYNNGRSITAAESHANARLFAAAGKLLEAAQAAVAFYDQLGALPDAHPIHALAAAIHEVTDAKS